MASDRTLESVTSPGELGAGLEKLARLEDLGTRFERNIEAVSEGLRRNEPYETHEIGLLEWLRTLLGQGIENLTQLCGGIRVLLQGLEPVLGELGQSLEKGVAELESLLRQGKDWVEANPEAVEAGLKLVLLAGLAAYRPDDFLALVGKRPELVMEPLAELLG
jgi:hypothetical protein